MRFILLKDLIHPLKNLPSRFRGPHPTFEPFLFNFNMGELEPPKLLLLMGPTNDHKRPYSERHPLASIENRWRPGSEVVGCTNAIGATQKS
eukprot:SAG22_NODE_2555_length_2451_cov_15.623299_2_plen_91_part_00